MIKNPEVLVAMFSEDERKAFSETVIKTLLELAAIKYPEFRCLLTKEKHKISS